MSEQRRVLVVEDDSTVRQVLTEILDYEGYEIRSAANGRDALDVLRVWHPDVVVMDLMMPIMDGWTFRDKMRELEEAGQVPVIVISAAREAPLLAERLDAAAVLLKPFSLDAVLSEVSRVAGHYST